MNWFAKLPLIRKFQWAAFLAVIAAVLFAPVVPLLESKESKEQRLRNEALANKKKQLLNQELEKQRKAEKILNTFEHRFGYRPELPYSDQETIRLATIFDEIYGNK